MIEGKICIGCQWWDEKFRHPDDTRIPAIQKKRALCRRFPQEAWKHSTEWCGEWDAVTTGHQEDK